MRSAPIRRRPPEGGYARGEETRRRIVTTALRLFGQRSFDGVSTREIAAEAGVNPPALQYYFDSKDGLYRACAEFVADQVLERVEPVVGRAERLLEDAGAPAAALVEAYCAVVETVLDLIFDPESAAWSPFLALEEAGLGPGTAFPVLKAQFLDRLNSVFAGLIGRLSGRPADALETRVRALIINGQFMVCQNKRSPGVDAMGGETNLADYTRLVKSIVVEQTRVLLTRLAPNS